MDNPTPTKASPGEMVERLDLLIAWRKPGGTTPKKKSPPLYKTLCEVRDRLVKLEGFIASPPRHDFWGAGEPDCPRDIKAGNGELHTLRCKRCGEDSPREDFCRQALDTATEVKHG